MCLYFNMVHLFALRPVATQFYLVQLPTAKNLYCWVPSFWQLWVLIDDLTYHNFHIYQLEAVFLLAKYNWIRATDYNFIFNVISILYRQLLVILFNTLAMSSERILNWFWSDIALVFLACIELLFLTMDLQSTVQGQKLLLLLQKILPLFGH